MIQSKIVFFSRFKPVGGKITFIKGRNPIKMYLLPFVNYQHSLTVLRHFDLNVPVA